MDSQHIKQSLGQLTFHLYNRAIHPELFEIYRPQQFFQGDYEVIIWITGCSHLISVFHGKDCLTEVIAGPMQILPERGLLKSLAFRGERQHQCEWAKDCKYAINFQVETMSTNLYTAIHKDLVQAARKRGIYVPFPQWAKGKLAPFSYVDYEARATELQVHAFHAFPDQLTVIKTQSLFSMPAV